MSVIQVKPEYVYNTNSGTIAELECNIDELISNTITKQFVEAFTQQFQDNDEEIGFVTSNGFELDFNKMMVGEKYFFDYYESKYMAIKNQNGEVELSEITIHG